MEESVSQLEQMSEEDLERELEHARQRLSQLQSLAEDDHSALGQLRQMFQMVFDTMPACIWWKDKESVYLGCNQKFASYAGLSSPAEIVGKTDFDMPWAETYAEEFVLTDRSVMDDGRLQLHVRAHRRMPDGTTAWLDTSTIPLHDAGGNIAGTLGTFEDITERVRAELDLEKTHDELSCAHEKLRAANEELEERVQERTAELEVARDRAVHMERLKDEFFANVSHELRTPLTLTLAPIESLLMGKYGPLDAEQSGLLSVVNNSAVRLLQMLSGLLDFAKLEAGKQQVNRQPTDAISFVKAIVEDFIPIVRQKGLKIKLELRPSQLLVDIDRYLFERILFNLLSNAVKYTDTDGEITVRLSDYGDRLRLSVDDTGAGIAPEQLSGLFHKFQPSDNGQSSNGGGTGLGLALVKQCATLLDGHVSVESTVGVGSSFLVEIQAPPVPSAVPEAVQTGVSPMVPLSFARLQTSIESMTDRTVLPKLLIAEDNVELTGYIVSLLQNRCQMKIATDGDEAWQLVQEWKPDLVLSDVMMPRRSGIGLCQLIKESEEYREIPVVLLTALTHRDAMLKGWEVGADDYLFKPFHPVELVTRLGALLKACDLRKQARDEIKSLHQSLKDRHADLSVTNRELELLSEHLRDVRDEAMDAVRTKSSFLANMSHEIRTPINGVIGTSDLLLRSPLSVEQRELTEIIWNSAQSLLEIVNDVLDYSKIEAGRVELEMTDFSVSNLLGEVAEMVAERARFKKLSLIVDTAENVPPVVNGDVGRVRQVLLNLVNNAVKFTDQGEVRLIAVSETNGELPAIRFAVEDTGIGLCVQSVEDLFQPFVQGDSSITRKYGGTGLGLSIAKHLVELMGGEISAESEVGKGSTFTFIVPLRPINANKSFRQESPAPSQDLDSIRFSPEQCSARILIVDDNPANQKLALMFLKHLGFTGQAVANGKEAVEAVAGATYGLIFMDCQMPIMDGFEATRAIRQKETDDRLRVPIIAMTAQALPGDRESCLNAGMDAYLSKPITIANLAQALRDWLPSEKEPVAKTIISGRPSRFTESEHQFAAELEYLNGLFGSEEAQELMHGFLAMVESLLDRIDAALCERDAELLKMLAHQLKGTSGSFNAHCLSEICQQLEQQLLISFPTDWPQCASICGNLHSAFELYAGERQI